MLRVIGAGLPRTGTNSLRLALERLLGGECYHMFTIKDDPAQAGTWLRALHGDLSGVHARLAGCAAAVDWPAAFFWRELLAASPDAVVVLSVRDSPATWWQSFDATVLERKRHPEALPGDDGSFAVMRDALLNRTLGPRWDDPETAMTSYLRYNAQVRAQCPPGRLVEWAPSAGWPPICDALGIAVPGEPFPQTNSATEFYARPKLTRGQDPRYAARLPLYQNCNVF
jgi:Sulfotransferase domain